MKPVLFPTVHARQDAWATHIQERISRLGIPEGTLADNLAASIATYCREFHPQGVKSIDLDLLLARAFCAVGDRAAASHVLVSMEPRRRHVDRWLEILSELHHFPQLLPYFSLGIIRPVDWSGAQLDRMWTLDFGRLSLSDAERHEMMLYRSIRMIVEKMFVFWDATAGEGVLGLKGLASLKVDSVAARSNTLTAAADLLDYISDLFRKRAMERSWTAIPTLLNLDL